MAWLRSILSAIVILTVMGAFAGVAASAQMPTVTTGAVSSVGDLSAVVTGTVNPDGVSAFTYVEVGTTTGYGSVFQAAPFSISGFSDVGLTATLSGLLPGTTYHYRVFSDLAGVGIRRGADMTFTTGPASTPPGVTSVSTTVTTTRANLTGSVSGGSSDATVSFEYGLTTAYGGAVAANLTAPLNSINWGCYAAITGLQPSTTYHLRCKAVNNEGTTYSTDATFTTLDVPVITTGSATDVTDLAAVLNGTIDPKGGNYFVYAHYGLTTAYGKSRNGDRFSGTGERPCSVNPSDLLPNTSYHYRLVAIDDYSVTYHGNDLTFTTGPASTPPTVGTSGALVSSSHATTAQLYLSLLHSGSSPTTVTFQYGLTTGYGIEAVYPTVFPANTFSDIYPAVVQLANLTPLATYHFRCKAANAEGTVYTLDNTFSMPAGPVLVTGAATGVTDLAATLQGSVNTNSLLLEVSFEIGTTTGYGQTEQVPAFQQNTSPAAVSVQPAGLLPGTTYHYRLKAANHYNISEVFYGPDATFTTGPAATPPTTGAVTSSGVLTRSAYVACSNVFSGSSPTSLVFEYGETAAYGASVPYDTTLPANVMQSPFVALGGLTPGTTYHVRAVATNAQGTSVSPDATFTTAAATPPALGVIVTLQVRTTAASVQVENASAGSSNATIAWDYGVTIAYGSTVTGNPATMTTDTSGVVTGLLTGLQPATTYHYRCRATSADGTGTSADGTFTTSSGPVVSTAAATSVGDLTAILNGSAATTTGNLTAFFEIGTTTSYGTTVNPSVPTISSATSTPVSALASGLLPNTTYHFRLSVRDLDDSVFSGADMVFTTGAPATPPTAETASPTGIAATAATLKAYVQSGSSPATIVFQYGTTTAYGSQITHGTPLATSQYDVISDPVTGLSPATTYHCRVVATNNEGVSTGGDITFTTPPLPTVTTGAATNVLPSTATLDGSYHKQGGTYTVAFDYGETTAYGLTATPGGGIIIIIGGGGGDTTQNTSATAAVEPQKTYHFRLKLTDNYGNSYYGSDETFTTPLPVEVWRQQYFGTTANAGDAADTANPSGDGISNLMKYALWMDPTQSGMEPSVALVDDNGSLYLSITFSRNPNAIDVIYEVQAADSPSGPWSTVTTIAPGGAAAGPGLIAENILAVGGGFGTIPIIISDIVHVRDIVSTTDAPRRFMQISVRH